MQSLVGLDISVGGAFWWNHFHLHCGFFVQLFAYDTVKNLLTPKPGEPSFLPVPPSTIAGASAGVCSTLTMYPLELLKTRLTVEVKSYLLDNNDHASPCLRLGDQCF